MNEWISWNLCVCYVMFMWVMFIAKSDIDTNEDMSLSILYLIGDMFLYIVYFTIKFLNGTPIYVWDLSSFWCNVML